MTNKDFQAGVYAGITLACDVVAQSGEGTLLREIIEMGGKDEMMKEINKNGLAETKQLMKKEFK